MSLTHDRLATSGLEADSGVSSFDCQDAIRSLLRVHIAYY